MMEIGFDQLSEAGIAIVIMVVGYLIIRVVFSGLLQIATIWREAARERNAMDERNITTINRAIDRLDQMDQRQEDMITSLAQAGTFIAGVRRNQEAIIASSKERQDELLKALAPIPQIAGDVADIKPNIDKMRSEIGELKTSLVSTIDELGVKLLRLDSIDDRLAAWDIARKKGETGELNPPRLTDHAARTVADGTDAPATDGAPEPCAESDTTTSEPPALAA